MNRAFEPALLVDLDLDRPLRPLDVAPYPRAVCLVRLHGQPLGLVEVRGSVDDAALGERVTAELGPAIAAHLEEDRREPCGRLRARALARPQRVTVAVPTHNRPEGLAAALRSLLAQDYQCFEIVVVDNAPADGRAAAVVARIGDDRIRYVTETRHGHSWARNRCLAEARTTLLAYLDDDAVADPRWLSSLVAAFDAADDVACVTGLVLPRELETEAQAWRDEYGASAKGFVRRVFHVDAATEDPLFPFTTGRIGSGASMAFRTDALRAVGGFDAALGSGRRPCGGEELSAFLRVLRARHTIVYEPGAIVRHAHDREYARLERQIYGYGVGLGAYLTSAVANDPRVLLEFARRARPALRYLLSSGSEKNRARDGSYPRSLARAELRGLLLGPLRYAAGRADARAVAGGAA